MVALVLVMGCTNVTSGTIVKKSYEPAWTQYVQTCVAYDTKGWCTVYTFVPVYWPEEYEFKLRDDRQDKPIDQRDTGWVDVSPADYERFSLGQHYTWSSS